MSLQRRADRPGAFLAPMGQTSCCFFPVCFFCCAHLPVLALLQVGRGAGKRGVAEESRITDSVFRQRRWQNGSLILENNISSDRVLFKGVKPSFFTHSTSGQAGFSPRLVVLVQTLSVPAAGGAAEPWERH